MDYVYFSLFAAFLVGVLILLTRMDARVKNRYRKAAYDLLEQPSPSGQEIRKAIKGLHLYSGRWRKDKEFRQLIVRLEEKLRSVEG
jgi:hypothetical protein